MPIGKWGIMKSILLLSLILTTLISCNAQKNGTDNISTDPVAETSKLPMKWDGANLPLTVYIGDTMLAEVSGEGDDSDGHNLIEQMEKQWNEADPARTYFNISSTHSRTNLNYTNLDSYLDGEIGIYKSTNWFSYIGSGVLAVTSYLGEYKGSYIKLSHADIIMNYRDYTFTNDTSNSYNYDLPSVVLHELGHMIGLKHTTSSVIPSVMQPTLSASEVKRVVTAYDISYVTSNYNNVAAISASALALTTEGEETPRYFKGYIEMRTDGNCYHYQNERLVEVHKHGINSTAD